MKFTVEIKMDNAAFEDSRELPRLLRKIAEQAEDARPGDARPVIDVNGATVGSWSIR